MVERVYYLCKYCGYKDEKIIIYGREIQGQNRQNYWFTSSSSPSVTKTVLSKAETESIELQEGTSVSSLDRPIHETTEKEMLNISCKEETVTDPTETESATLIDSSARDDILDEKYGTDVFTDPTIKGKLGVNAMKAKKHLYDHIVYDSSNERDFATDLDTSVDVAVYVKLPDGFYISTPVGHYNPDWAIAFYEGNVKHIYFVAETKGSMQSMQLRAIEESKIHCAREHFKAISNGNVVYDVVDSYKSLMEKVMK